MPLLGLLSALVIGRVGKLEFIMHRRFPNFVALVKRYAKGLVRVQALQDVHVISDDGLPFAVLGQVSIPTGPGGFSPGEQ